MKTQLKKAMLAIFAMVIACNVNVTAQDTTDSLTVENDTVVYSDTVIYSDTVLYSHTSTIIRADVNEDAKVDVADVATIINAMIDVPDTLETSSILVTANKDSLTLTYSAQKDSLIFKVFKDRLTGLYKDSVVVDYPFQFIQEQEPDPDPDPEPNPEPNPEPGPEPDPEPYEHDTPSSLEAVDLHLPSGTLWASLNLGAESEADYGYYVAWGDTIGHAAGDGHEFNWKNYRFMPEGLSSWLKITQYQVYDEQYKADWYVNNSEFIGDNKAVLKPEDDVANLMWGGNWQIPTYEQIDELMNYCKKEWDSSTDANGYTVSGTRFTSKINGASIFLPAAGYRTASDEKAGTCGQYWSSTLHPTYTANARYLYFTQSDRRISDGFRSYGQSIRPVCKSRKEPNDNNGNDDGEYNGNDDGNDNGNDNGNGEETE